MKMSVKLQVLVTFCPGKNPLGRILRGPRADLDMLAVRKISPLPGTEPRPPVSSQSLYWLFSLISCCIVCYCVTECSWLYNEFIIYSFLYFLWL